MFQVSKSASLQEEVAKLKETLTKLQAEKEQESLQVSMGEAG
jgi:hypothetical protein